MRLYISLSLLILCGLSEAGMTAHCLEPLTEPDKGKKLNIYGFGSLQHLESHEQIKTITLYCTVIVDERCQLPPSFEQISATSTCDTVCFTSLFSNSSQNTIL